MTSTYGRVYNLVQQTTKRNASMNRFTFNLATLDDDASLRDLLAATPMEGAISLAFAREPNYFTRQRSMAGMCKLALCATANRNKL